MKKLLILGANPETASLVQKANEMGVYNIVTDYDPKAYAKRFASKAFNVDAADVDALEKLARDEHVDGVAVGVAEALLTAYCKLCERLQVPCYTNLEQIEIMVNKNRFKEQCRKYGVPTIKEYSTDDMDAIAYPVIVKPIDSCSSKGIRICTDRQELTAAIDYALSFSKSGQYLIEQYMTGDEVISYYVIQDGNPIFVAMCDRYTYREKEGLVQLPNSYIFPSRHIASYMNATDPLVKRMIRKIGLRNGSIFFQAFADEDGTVRIYEPGFRLNGAQEHMLVSRLSGIDAKELYINLALDGKVSQVDLAPMSNPRHEQLACKLSPLVRTGKIGQIMGLEEIAKLPDVLSVNPSYDAGDTVTGEGTLKQIICRFFIVSQDKQCLKETIDRIYQLLEVNTPDGESMLIGRFNTGIIDALY